MKPNQITTILFAIATLVACEQRPVDLAPTTAEVDWERLHTFEESASATVVWANGPSDVYVGYYGIPDGQTSALLHFNGSAWASVDLPSSEPARVRYLWGAASGELYVSSQSLLRWNDNAWELMPVPAGRIAGTSNADVYVASRNHVTHFNGASWDTILASPTSIRSIYAFPGPEVVAARDDSILWWNGSTWRREPAVGAINDMWGLAPNDLYAVGHHSGSQNGAAAWHWNGTSWINQAVPSNLLWIDAVSGSGTGNVVATSEYNGAMLQLEGDIWEKIQLPTSRLFSDVTFTGPDEWLAVGEEDKVIRQSGSSWSTLRDGGPGEAAVAWMDSRDFAVVAEDGSEARDALYRFDGGVWLEDTLRFGAPTAIAGSSRTNIYMTTWSHSIFRFNGSVWSSVVDTLTAVQRDLSVAADGGVFTVGDGTIYRSDGSAWELTYSGGRRFERVWARNRNEAYAIDHETLMGFTGGTWRVLHEDSDHYYRDVWGASSGEVYVASSSGIYRYYSGTFERVTPDWYVETISGTSSTDILAASQSYFFLFDGVLWSPGNNTLLGYGPQLNTAPGGDIFMLGRESFAHTYQRDVLFVRRR